MSLTDKEIQEILATEPSRGGNPAYSLDQILVENSSYQSNKLRKRLLKEGIKEHKCESCSLTEWMGKPISLELEHINGNNSDNRIENLKLLCPNCHAQTEHYRGKNWGKANNKHHYSPS